MRVVALLSGGKDSVYNIMKCIHYGHDIVCVGNIRPATDGVDELDSEMYQTVGWNGVQLIAQAMNVPFYSVTTRGKSTQHTVAYNHKGIEKKIGNGDENEDDEVEDMYRLLAMVQRTHPDIEAVSSGAILSNYQRNRVESVCVRLKLVSLSFLWQRTDQDILLREMIHAGIDAVIIKCASMGLSPTAFLGQSLRNENIVTQLNALGRTFGMNVCGEGGEYETFVVDCPLFAQYKISIDESSICGDVQGPVAPTGYLKFHQLSLVAKTSVNAVAQSAQLNEEKTENDEWTMLNVSPRQSWIEPQYLESTNVCNYGACNGIFQFVAHPNISLNTKYIHELDLGAELSLLFDALRMKLAKFQLCMDDIFYCQLFLSDMALFSTVNAMYKSQFATVLHAPSRVCCQLELSHEHRISLEALAYKHKSNAQRYQCLHVQSMSEWAPTCIGPYSQASKIANCFIFCAGAIGLVPSTMQMVPNTRPKTQIEQTWKNVRAVLTAFDSELSLAVHHNIFVIAAPESESETPTQHASDVQNVTAPVNMHHHGIDDDNIETDDDDLQLQDKDNSHTIGNDDTIDIDMNCAHKTMDTYLFGLVRESVNNFLPQVQTHPFNAVVIYVPDLPKHALIEVQTLSLTRRCINDLNAAKSESLDNEKEGKLIVPNRENASNTTEATSKRKVQLKYAHIKRKKKKTGTKRDVYGVHKECKQHEIGTFLVIKTRTVYNLYDRWCSVVSIGELCHAHARSALSDIAALIKSALSQSLLYVNGYAHMLQQRQHQAQGDVQFQWAEQCIVFLRVYYDCETLEPKSLNAALGGCFQDLSISKVPAVSFIPVRGVRFVADQDRTDTKCGIYMLHCFLYHPK